MKLKNIQNLKVKSPYFLAPMHEINDIAFRILCRKAGAGLTYTGLTSCLSKEDFVFEDAPAVQLMANSTKGIKEFIKKYEKSVSLFDFNLGCPSKRSEKSNVGYFMSKDFSLIEDIFKTIKTSTKKPFTVKIRKMPINQTKKIIFILNKYCDAVSIHPRTQEQGYSGKPDLKYALFVKSLLKENVKTIYSGDIQDKKQAEIIFNNGFDFIMVGRASIGNPNIFAELSGLNKIKNPFEKYIKLAEKYNLEFKQIKLQAIQFTKGIKGSAKLRQKISKTKGVEEIKEIMN